MHRCPKGGHPDETRGDHLLHMHNTITKLRDRSKKVTNPSKEQQRIPSEWYLSLITLCFADGNLNEMSWDEEAGERARGTLDGMARSCPETHIPSDQHHSLKVNILCCLICSQAYVKWPRFPAKYPWIKPRQRILTLSVRWQYSERNSIQTRVQHQEQKPKHV